MADLGSLNLILGADLSPLEASLGRAESLVNQASDRMGRSFKPFKFKVEVGDLAVQLTQAEGVVDRSIRQVRSIVKQPIKFNIETGDLGVQLTEAEALVDRTVRDIKSMDRSIDLNINVRGLDDSESMVARSIQQIQGLTAQVFRIQVDDTRLTELNQHLDSKQAHYKRVQSDFATPLKVLVDDTQLTALNQHLTVTERHLASAIAQFSGNTIAPTINLTNLNLLDRRLASTVDNLHQTQAEFNDPIVTRVDSKQLLELEDLLDRVEKPHKFRLDLPDTIGGLTSAIGKLALSPVTIPIKIAQNSLEGMFRGMSEGLGRELTRNFSKGFSSSIESFITKKTGMSTTEMGAQSGKYVATRGKIGAEYISQELGYKDGLRGVGSDLKAAGTSVDTVLRNPRRAVKKIENKLVEALEYYQEGETEKAMNVVTESFAPMGKLARRAVGVGIRAAAQPIRIRNRAMLKGKVAEAEALAKNMEIDGYDREAADKAEAIHIVTGGLDFNNGENAHFAGGLLKQMYPKAHTITHVNKAMNQPVERGQGVVGGMMGMMEQLQKMGGKEGKIGDMPIQKLAEMAIDLGYNPDGLEMYAKAVKVRQAHPDKPINFMGTSGGVDAVNYAVALSERAGMKNVKGVGLGLPMTNLTELASKQNFTSLVGTLDNLDLAYHNEDHLGAKRLADPESMAKLRKTKAEKFPLDMSGIVSVGKTQQHVVDAGLDHAIGTTYLGNSNVMSAMNDFIARSDAPYPHVRTDIKKASNLNNFYSEKFNAKRKEIPLTIAALYKDPKALARIEADPDGKTGDYTYFSPANKNHEDDWLRTNEFEGLIKDVRGEDIEGRSAEENAKSRKKGLNDFIEDNRRRAAKKGTKSVVAEHAAGWLDYLDTMKSGMEEYGKTGAMPFEALQKGAEYYPELRPLAAREQHKQEMVLSPYLTPSGIETQKRSVDTLYASGDIKKINERRSIDKLAPIDNNYGYKDALATPDWYLKDLDKQRADTAAEMAKNQAEIDKLRNNPSAQGRSTVGSPTRSSSLGGSPAQMSDPRINFTDNRLQPLQIPTPVGSGVKTPAQTIDPNTATSLKLDSTASFAAAVDKFAQAVDRFGGGQGIDPRPKVEFGNPPADPEPVEVGVGGLAEKARNRNQPSRRDGIIEVATNVRDGVGNAFNAIERTKNYASEHDIGGKVASTFKAGRDAIGGIFNAGQDATDYLAENQVGQKIVSGATAAARGINRVSRFGVNSLAATYRFGRSVRTVIDATKAPDVIDPVQDARNKAIIEATQREEEAKLAQKIESLPDRPKLSISNQSIDTKKIEGNFKDFIFKDGKSIQSTVSKSNAEFTDTKKKLVTDLKSSDTNIVAQALLEAQKFAYGINIRQEKLESILTEIEVAKQQLVENAKQKGVKYKRLGDLPGYTDLENARKSVDVTLRNKSATFNPIQGEIERIQADKGLSASIEQIIPEYKAKNGNIFENIKNIAKSQSSSKSKKPPDEAGFSTIEATIASLIAAIAVPLVGAPIAAPIAIGGGLIAALKKSPFAKSALGQTRIPGLDFLDTPVAEIIPNIKSAAGKIFGGKVNSTPQFTPNPNAPSIPVLRNPLLYTPTFTPNPIAPPPPTLPNPLLYNPPSSPPENNKPSIFAKVTEDLNRFQIATKLVFGGLFALTAATIGVPAMIALGKSTLDTAGNFEALQIKLQAASDSLQSGKNLYQSVSAEASKRGISRSAALETGAAVAGTTFGTELEGAPSNQITSQVLQLAQYRGLNKEQTGGLTLAINQTLGRDRASAQEINQLINSGGIPDARAIAARGLGYTPQQFAKVQESSTGIDSKKFVQAFLSQGIQDSLLVKDSVLDTQQAKITKLQAKTEEFQGAIGAGINPAFKAGLDLLTGALELLVKGMESGSKVLAGAAVYSFFSMGAALLDLGSKLIKFDFLRATMFDGFSNSLKAIGPQLLKVAGYGLLFAALGETFSQLGKEFGNTSQDMADATNKLIKTLDELDGKKVNVDLPQKASDVGGDGWFDTAITATQRFGQDFVRGTHIIANGVTGQDPLKGVKDASEYGRDNKQKEQDDRDVEIQRGSETGSISIAKTTAALKKAEKLRQIDLDLNALATERSGLFANGEPNADKIANIQKRYQTKFQERSNLISGTKNPDGTDKKDGLSADQAAAQENLNAAKGRKADLESKLGKKQIGQQEYNRNMAVVVKDIEAAEAAQRKLNEAIKSGLDDLTPWTRQLDEIVGKFEDIATQSGLVEQNMSMSRNTRETSGKLLPGQAQYVAATDKQALIQDQIKSTAATIKELRVALNSKDPKNVENVKKGYQVNDTTTATQLRIKAEQASSPGDKETLSKLAIAKEQEVKLAGLQSQFSDARTEMYRRIEAENREAMLYYVNLAKQIDPQGTAFTQAIAQVTQNKNRLLSKLNGYGNGMFDSFIGSVVELFDASKKQLEAMAAYAQARKQAFDEYRDRNYQAETTNRNAFNAPGTQSAAPSNYPGGETSTNTGGREPIQAAPNRTVRSDVGSSQPTVQTDTPRQAQPQQQLAARTRSANKATQSQINASLAKLTPAERHRYLHTNLSVDGKTDLGLDDFDRRVLGMGGGIPGVKVKKIPTSPFYRTTGSSNRTIVDAINNGTYKSGQTTGQVTQPVDRSTSILTPESNNTPATKKGIPAKNNPIASKPGEVGRIQGDKLKTWAENSQEASQKILKQGLDRAQTQFDTTSSDNDYQTIINEQKVRRETRLKEQEVRRTERQNQKTLKGLKPTRTIQEKQAQERENYEDTALDTKDTISNNVTNLKESLSDTRQVIKYLQSRQGVAGLDASDRKLPVAQQQAAIEARKRKLDDTIVLERNLTKYAADAEKTLGQIDARIKAGRDRVIEEQKYQNEVTTEQTQIQADESRRNQIEAKRSGIQQQLKTQGFNSGLNANERGLEEQGTKIAIENERKQAQRTITDKERGGGYATNGRTEAQVKAYVAKLRAEVDRTAQQKLTSSAENRVQKSREFDLKVKDENQGLDIAQSQQKSTAIDIDTRRQAAVDRTDSQFANNKAIDDAYDRKVSELDTETKTAKDAFDKQQEKYRGNDPTSQGLLERAKQQYAEATRQIQLKKSTAKLESDTDTVDRQSSRRSYLYEQNQTQVSTDFSVYDAQTAQQKLLGQDTRDRDFTRQQSAIQNETDRGVFAATERRAKITAATPEAEAERGAIDKLIASLKELNTIKLTNLASEFNQFNQIVSDTQKSTTDVFKSFMGGGNFDLKKLLSAPFLTFGNQMIDKIIPDLFSGLYQKSSGNVSQPQKAGGGLLEGGVNLIKNLFGIKSDPTPPPPPVTSTVMGGSPATLAATTPSNESPLQQSKPFDWNSVDRPDLQPVAPEPFTIPPAPKSQFEGMPEQPNNLLGSTLETDIPVLTNAIDNLTSAITNSSMTSGLPSAIVSGAQNDLNLPFSDPQAANTTLPFSANDDPYSFSGSKLTNSASKSPISNSLLGGLTGILGKGQSKTTNTLLGAGMSLLGGLLGFANGGIKDSLAPINSGIIGSGRSQVDNRLAIVEDGEAIITHRGIDALGGPSTIAKINKGDIPRFASGGIKGANYASPRPNTSVPTLTNNATSLSNVNANVTINNSGNGSSVQTKEDGSKLARLVNNAISEALIKEQRAGGLLYS